MEARISAHIVNEKRMYKVGSYAFATEEVMIKALRKAGYNPIVTATGITYTVKDTDLLGQLGKGGRDGQ